MVQHSHPEYAYEQKRLIATQRYIEAVLKSSEKNRSVYQRNIKQAMEELDFLDSSQSYINILVNAKFLDMTARDLEQLAAILDKPYFSRIDFQLEGSDQPEKFYIGKTSLYRRDNHRPVIVDWRSPIANLYYEGRLGEVSYRSETEEIRGKLSLKRQYDIENGTLKDFQDVDATSRDELLQASLNRSADHRLNEIVATIQAEQNRVIRADLHRSLIVQGAAGSGKTTIALHRIAYFLYQRAGQFDPEEMLILAPNRLFLGTISNVLPELGVQKVRQTTFIDFFRETVGKKFRLLNPQKKLLAFINEDLETEEKHRQMTICRMKGSLQYKEAIDAYIDQVVENLIPKRDLKLGKRIIRTQEEISRWLTTDYKHLPVYKRLEKIRQLLNKDMKQRSKEILKEATTFYEDRIERALTQIRDPEKRRETVIRLMDKKDATLPAD